MMRYAYIFSLLFLLNSCVRHEAPPPLPEIVDEAKPIQCQEVSRIAYTVTEELEAFGDYHLCKAYLCDVEPAPRKVIMIEFYSQELLELEDGRDMIVVIVESILGKIRRHPFLFKTMPNVPGSPGSADDLHIIVELESYYGKYVDPLYLGRIELKDGIVRYFAHTALDFETIVFQRHLEPYTTARMISRVKDEVAVEFGKEAERRVNRGSPGLTENTLIPVLVR